MPEGKVPGGDGQSGLGQGQLSPLQTVLLLVPRFHVGRLGTVCGVQRKCRPGLGCCC